MDITAAWAGVRLRALMAPAWRASVMTTRLKWSWLRSSPVTIVLLRAAGRREGSTLGRVRKLVMTCLVPFLMAFANGGGAVALICGRGRVGVAGCTSGVSGGAPV